MAAGGFLAGYAGATRSSYATDLRIFATWCRQADLSLLAVRRSHLELFVRWMEETGRMRSTVRRLSTPTSFYRYCEQEQLVDRNPALNVRRPERGHRTLKIFRKGGKRAIIPLAPRTSRVVDLYLNERATGPIFLGAKGGRMDRYAADRMVKRLARRAGINKRISPHSLRHSFITAALDAGVPLRDVQEAASHADPRTTMLAGGGGRGQVVGT